MPKICDYCVKLPWGLTAKKRCICHGFNLDLGCGPHKQKGFIGSDKRDINGVDLVFDIEKFPWPVPGNSVDKLLMSHVLEHMKPWLVNDIMNEMWRVMHPNGQALIAVPYAGSFGFWQDPTHTKGYNEATWAYYDPAHPSRLYTIYEPYPWKITRCNFNPLSNMEVIMEPRKLCDHGRVYENGHPGKEYCLCCWNKVIDDPVKVKLCAHCALPLRKSIQSNLLFNATDSVNVRSIKQTLRERKR